MRILILSFCLLFVACSGEETTTNSFLNYTLFDKTSSATIVNDNNEVVSIWKTTPIDKRRSVINWGDNEEFFYWDDKWIYLDKYKNVLSNKEYDQYVTKQEFCQYDVCTIISTDGKQKYAPASVIDNYTIDTIGFIIEINSGKKIEFRHTQNVYVGVSCSNQYHGEQICLVQNEKWWDNNQSEYKLKLYRNTWYAKNLGAGFIIENKIPEPWRAYMK